MGRRQVTAATDEALAATARFEALYHAHARAMTAYCARRLPKHEVADAVAETFLVAWRRIDDVPDGDAGRLWLYRVAHRVVGHNWRSSKRRKRLISRAVSRRPDEVAGPEELAIDDDDIQRVLEAASRLNANDAEILRLSVWERLEIVEIAAILEIEPNAASQRLYRAKQHLVREYDAVTSRAFHDATCPRGGPT